MKSIYEIKEGPIKTILYACSNQAKQIIFFLFSLCLVFYNSNK